MEKHLGPAQGSIVVVAKCPLPGQSKTRLIPLLGPQGSAALAKAMLLDVLTTLTACEELASVDKILLYAPPTEEGKARMVSILDACDIPHSAAGNHWSLLPMVTANNLRSSDLGSILTTALQTVRRQRQNKPAPVVFLGMDSPELPVPDLVACLRHSGTALMCPAADGGYGLLSVPVEAPADELFASVRWSDPLTAVSQLKALTDAGVSVRLGPLMYDIDEPEDVQALCERLSGTSKEQEEEEEEEEEDCLSRPSPLADSTSIATRGTSPCRYTRQALVDLGLLQVDLQVNG